MPENWVQRPVVNTEEGSNPGAPLAWGSPENPDDAVAGYGYVPCDTSEVEETFYYHSDHLGSTAYITDQKANVTQYDAYLPYGELLVDEHSSSKEMPYKFNGKELDEETGLYYYGARYMNPITSMWYGVDPLAEKYPNVSAFVYCMGNPVKLVDPDGQEPTYEEALAIAKHVYGDETDDILCGGWRPSPLSLYGVVYNDKSTGLTSRLYERVVDGKVTEYVYATAGTDIANDGAMDVLADLFQEFGRSKQYRQAMENAELLSLQLINQELSYVGHSLGGGEGAVNLLATASDNPEKRCAITFNAAGVSDSTMKYYGLSTDYEYKITNYSTSIDWLTSAGNSTTAASSAKGITETIPPVDASGPFDAHRLKSFPEKLEW